MAYYLTVKGTKGYEIIDITKSNYFARLSNLKQPGACQLQEIDAFTIMFDNELELKAHLYMEGLITEKQCTKPLSIRIKHKEQYNKVMYNLLYQPDAYLFAPCNLKYELLNRSDDVEFLEKFVHHYYDFYDCRISINELGVYVSDYKRCGYKNKYVNERYSEVIDLLMYKNGNTEEIKYSNIHSMVAFISNYDRKTKEIEKPITRTKANKTKDPIDGQQSLFED